MKMFNKAFAWCLAVCVVLGVVFSVCCSYFQRDAAPVDDKKGASDTEATGPPSEVFSNDLVWEEFDRDSYADIMFSDRLIV